jgi:hypothetical protein
MLLGRKHSLRMYKKKDKKRFHFAATKFSALFRTIENRAEDSSQSVSQAGRQACWRAATRCVSARVPLLGNGEK